MNHYIEGVFPQFRLTPSGGHICAQLIFIINKD